MVVTRSGSRAVDDERDDTTNNTSTTTTRARTRAQVRAAQESGLTDTSRVIGNSKTQAEASAPPEALEEVRSTSQVAATPTRKLRSSSRKRTPALRGKENYEQSLSDVVVNMNATRWRNVEKSSERNDKSTIPKSELETTGSSNDPPLRRSSRKMSSSKRSKASSSVDNARTLPEVINLEDSESPLDNNPSKMKSSQGTKKKLASHLSSTGKVAPVSMAFNLDKEESLSSTGARDDIVSLGTSECADEHNIDISKTTNEERNNSRKGPVCDNDSRKALSGNGAEEANLKGTETVEQAGKTKDRGSVLLNTSESQKEISSDIVETKKLDRETKLSMDTKNEVEKPVLEAPINSVSDILSISEDKMPAFFSRNEQVTTVCREVIAASYGQQTKLELGDNMHMQFIPKKRKGLPPLGPLPHLEIGKAFGIDQLWEELELRNKPLMAHIKRRLRAIATEEEEKKRALARVNMLPDEPSSDDEKDGEQDIPNVSVSMSDEEPSEGLEKNRRGQGEAVNQNGQVEHDSESEDEENGEAQKSKARVEKKQRVRFNLDDDNDGKSKDKLVSEEIEDGFFSLKDMELFAHDAEQLGRAGKLVVSDNEDEESSRNSGSEMDLSDDDGMVQRGDRIVYSDFFDAPNDSGGQFSSGGAIRRAQLLEDEELSDEEVGNGNLENKMSGEDKLAETPLEKLRVRDRRMIKAIEDASIEKKAWELRGEISGHARPKDSVLETAMEHDVTVRSNGFLSSEVNNIIEDVIKQRIVDGLFDDVVMAAPEEYAKKKAGKKDEIPEVSQEKPTEGLGELYAKEFIQEGEKKKAGGLASKDTKKEEEECITKEQKEVNVLFDKLASKLDSLCNMHFTPRMEIGEPEKVSGNVRAIRSEEALPESVSDARAVTAREVYRVGKDGLSADAEKSKQDRKSERQRKKSRKRKRRGELQRKEDALAKSDPRLAEKRRGDAALVRRGKKARVAENVSDVPRNITKAAFAAVASKEGGAEERRDNNGTNISASHLRL